MGTFILIIFLAVVFYILIDVIKETRNDKEGIIIESEIILDDKTKKKILERIKKDIAFRSKMRKIAKNKKRDKNGRFVSNKIKQKNMLIGKIKIKDFINCGSACQNLMKQQLEAKTAYWIGKIAKTADDEIKIYNNLMTEKINTLRKKYLKFDENGKLAKEDNKAVFLEGMKEEDYNDEFNNAIEELQNIEVDFGNIEKISLSKITCNISSQDILNLSFMIDETN